VHLLRRGKVLQWSGLLLEQTLGQKPLCYSSDGLRLSSMTAAPARTPGARQTDRAARARRGRAQR
jgi:hypothetical protein